MRHGFYFLFTTAILWFPVALASLPSLHSSFFAPTPALMPQHIPSSCSSIRHVPRGGGGGAGTSTSSSSSSAAGVDVAAIFGLAKSVATAIWNQPVVQEAIQTSPADAIAKVGMFVRSQRTAAYRRRQAYSQSVETTSSAICSPQRALKLTLLAFVVAELLQFLEETSTVPLVGSFGVKAKKISATWSTQWDNFQLVGRAKGGLLRPETWTDRVALTRALQEQVEPKYQWALGAAVGFVLSPVAWTLSWTVLGWSASVYIIAEVHHLLKTNVDNYYHTLKKWDNPIIFAVDDILEDLRKFVAHAIAAPKETLLAMRDDIDDRIDFDFPPHVQKGLLFGAIVGIVTGV
ncbi:hypothetical protein ACA910_022259 [Epithemia clementina (nom. ined.)]